MFMDSYVLTGSTDNRRSIAVLPFINDSAAEENAEFFANGIHEELLSRLLNIRSLKVIPRTSVMGYRDTSKNMRQIGQELGVATILEGSVQRAGDTVHVNVQLFNAETEERLWGDTFNRELTAGDVFAIQAQVATAIAQALQTTLTPEERERLEKVHTENIAALEAYFRGRERLVQRDGESLLLAIDYFQQAVNEDPNFALAYSGLADAYTVLPEYFVSADQDSTRISSEAEEAALLALSRDPELPEAFASAAWSRLHHHYDWVGAERLLRHALKIQPQNLNALHWLSHVLSWQGQSAEAIELAEEGVLADSVSPLMRTNLSYIHMDARNFDQSIELVIQVAAESPDFLSVQRGLWQAQMRAGYYEAAKPSLLEWAERTGRDVEAIDQIADLIIRNPRNGQPIDIDDRLLARLAVGSGHHAQLYAFAGDAEATLDALERGINERLGSLSIMSMKVNPAYDFVRNEPRFLQLLQRAGLAPERMDENPVN
jgi:TolB-like protein